MIFVYSVKNLELILAENEAYDEIMPYETISCSNYKINNMDVLNCENNYLNLT